MFDTVSYFHPCLTFAGKVRSLPTGCSPTGGLILGRKDLPAWVDLTDID